MKWNEPGRQKLELYNSHYQTPHMHIHTHTLTHSTTHTHTYAYTCINRDTYIIHTPTHMHRHTCKLVTTGPFFLFKRKVPLGHKSRVRLTVLTWGPSHHAWSWQVTTQTLFPTLNCGPSSHSVLINHSFFLSPSKGHQRKGILFC